MNRKIKVLVACPAPADGTSFYRGMGPFSTLQKQFPEIEITPGGMNTTDYTWDKLRLYDVLFFQRPTVPSHLQIIDQALANHIPVWIDYDDDLLSVPKENPTYPLYSNPQNKMVIVESLKRANFVSVSTQKLKEAMSPFSQAIQIIPNALDNTLLARKKLKPMKERNKIVLWRGSSTHVGDLLIFKDSILKAHRKHPDWKWYFLGYEPFFITGEMEPTSFGVAPFASHVEYFNLIQTVQAPLQIVPLPQTPFNESKSNIAWIEGTLAGSACLCPNFDAWKHAGVMNYETKEEFESKLDYALSDPDSLDRYQEQSWETIQKYLLLTDVNEMRKRCLEKLVIHSVRHKKSFGITPLTRELEAIPDSATVGGI